MSLSRGATLSHCVSAASRLGVELCDLARCDYRTGRPYNGAMSTERTLKTLQVGLETVSLVSDDDGHMRIRNDDTLAALPVSLHEAAIFFGSDTSSIHRFFIE